MAGGGGAEEGCGSELTLLAARRQVSPYVMRVRVALNLKGLRYAYVLEDLSAKSALLLELLGRLERDVLGDGRRFFSGDAIGYLDVVLGSFLSWLEALRAVAGVALLDAARTPRLAAWAERFGASEAVRPVTPEVGWVVAYADMLRERWDAEEGITK
ncbi:uncharacterized protein C2845_PM03G22720 [Panicum miliaceum]|uniref:Glutathione S-transferase n=1 Tax=Panicum miliaceum TaxID=4540 RepID=A0A3L6TA47_PANMI|nr:uncharacterized protein C2845_PM03G22720 [Panicum miliaceum]